MFARSGLVAFVKGIFRCDFVLGVKIPFKKVWSNLEVGHLINGAKSYPRSLPTISQWYNRRALGKMKFSLITIFPDAKLSKGLGTPFLASNYTTNL